MTQVEKKNFQHKIHWATHGSDGKMRIYNHETTTNIVIN